MIVVDKNVADFHGSELHNYLLLLMNTVSQDLLRLIAVIFEKKRLISCVVDRSKVCSKVTVSVLG